VQDEPVQLGLFGDQRLPLTKAVEFYKHDQLWMNRMVLGDSLLVMNSLLHQENLGGHVQMVYIDPPCGIAYNSRLAAAACACAGGGVEVPSQMRTHRSETPLPRESRKVRPTRVRRH
jgi:hypothetical protein